SSSPCATRQPHPPSSASSDFGEMSPPPSPPEPPTPVVVVAPLVIALLLLDVAPPAPPLPELLLLDAAPPLPELLLLDAAPPVPGPTGQVPRSHVPPGHAVPSSAGCHAVAETLESQTSHALSGFAMPFATSAPSMKHFGPPEPSSQTSPSPHAVPSSRSGCV